MKVAHTLLFVTFAALVSACGSDSDGNSSPATGGIEFDTLEVIGTSDPTVPTDPPPIAANENDGVFRILWESESQERYTASLYVSDDQTPNNEDDVLIAQLSCNSGGVCGVSTDMSCQYRSDNSVSCAGQNADLTDWFDALPQRGSIVLLSTNDQGRIKFESVRVEFR